MEDETKKETGQPEKESLKDKAKKLLEKAKKSKALEDVKKAAQ